LKTWWCALTGIDEGRSGNGLVDEEGDMDQEGTEFERCVDGVLIKETNTALLHRIMIHVEPIYVLSIRILEFVASFV